MFARVTRPAHVCLRCQLRLQTEAVRLSSLRLPPSVSRLQSTAAAKQDDERDESRSLHDRQWHTGRTASLGVTSLGKPAEVIILPAVDRKIPTLPKDQEKDDNAGSLQAHIDLENEPLISEQLIENIDQVAPKFDPRERNLTVEEYTQLRRTLGAGFTVHQLRYYVKYKTSSRIAKAQKNRIETINLIIKGIWGHLLPVRDADSDREIDRSLQKISYRIHKLKYQFILTNKNPYFKDVLDTLARTFDVKIDLYRKDRVVTISGKAYDCNACLKSLAKYVSDVTITHISAVRDLTVLSNPAYRTATKSFLEGLGRKYQLTIYRNLSAIKIYHYKNLANVAQAVREIRNAGEPRRFPHQVHVWPQNLQAQSLLQPHPVPVEANFAIAQGAWGRLSSTVPGAQLLDSSKEEEVSEELKVLEQNLDEFFYANELLRPVTSRMDMHYDMSAQFGKVLFRTSPTFTDRSGTQVPDRHLKHQKALSAPSGTSESDDNATLSTTSEEKEAGPPNDEQAVLDSTESMTQTQNQDSSQSTNESTSTPLLSNPTFTGQIGYAAQQIVTLDHWKDASSMISAGSPSGSQVLFRIILRPPDLQKGMAPVLEILGTCDDWGRGELEITRITAVHAERSFYLLLPDQNVDVKLVRQMKHDIYFKGVEVKKAYEGVVDMLKANISKTMNLRALESLFVPILEIPMPSVLRTMVSKMNAAVAAGKAFSYGRRKEFGDHKMLKIEYTQKSVEILDVDLRTMPVSTPGMKDVPMALEYMTHSGSRTVCHDLRLSEQPFHARNFKTQLTLGGFAHAAIQVARQLGHRPSSKQFGSLKFPPFPESCRAPPSTAAVEDVIINDHRKEERERAKARKAYIRAEIAAKAAARAEAEGEKADAKGTPQEPQPSPKAEDSTSVEPQEKEPTSGETLKKKRATKKKGPTKKQPPIKIKTKKEKRAATKKKKAKAKAKEAKKA
ncbi:hypothetical protein B0A52_06303 [Exophiala mesophila]|uniref:Uncharacterized protein n=1 Tax=Exophiala mesophila TaxID=212818 RepID=A0A438N314_EXOME|nr:hypothetical protein B0A52_06303 [Exophiala mesophila]